MSEILVVDDEQPIRFLLSEILKKNEHNVTLASNGAEAIGLIREYTYDLVVSDMHMDRLGGIDVLHAVKECDPLTEVVILTGYGSISSAVEAMQHGAFVYLTKPIEVQEFRVKVEQALERRAMRVQIEKQEREIQEHQEMIDRDLKLAEQVQRSLLPDAELDDKRFRAAIRYSPMIGVGGDFSDIFYDGESEIYLTIVDVTGHGITAALLVNRICMEVRRLVREQLEPSTILFHLNDFIVDSFMGTGMFLTMFSCAINLETGLLRYAGSAHPPIVVWRREQNKFSYLESQNLIIGFEKAAENSFLQDSTRLNAGDKLMLYTDGILEIEDRQRRPLGLEGVTNLLSPVIYLTPTEIGDSVMNGMRRFAHGAQRDDVYLILFEMQ